MKCNTYKELAEAYASGELTDDTPLIVDNDCCFVFVDDERVFSGNGPFDFHEVLDLLGIPNEAC